MSKKSNIDNQPVLFDAEEMGRITPGDLWEERNKPVTCLGHEFPNDEARREFFREELRKMLPELRKIEGFPIGTDEDIIRLSDPPYYTACPNPWLNDFIAEWEKEKVQLEKEGKRKADFEVKEPYASDVSEGRSNPVYVAHSYHTKCPHPAIMRYILHYTQPGDIIFDGFAGTGMTGVAANLCGSEAEIAKLNEKDVTIGTRHCVCGDLSPFASNISQGYNLPCNTIAVKQELQRIYDELVDECGWMYEVRDEPNGPKGHIHFVVWSDLFRCPSCGKEYSLWDVAIDKENKCLRDKYPCPHCGAEQDTHTANVAKETYFDTALNEVRERVKEEPGIIVYTIGKKRKERGANEFDVEIQKRIEGERINGIFPTLEMPQGDESRRNDSINITHSHHYFTKRTLITLTQLNSKINQSSYASQLRYVFTSMIGRSMKLNRFSPRNYFFGGGGWVKGILNGTLYVPSLPVEVSVLEQLSGKINMFDGLKDYLPQKATNAVSVMSACAVPMADNSVDYIFTDPPFGANIMYSELNFVQEAWLRVRTNNETEAIVNKTQRKGLQEYQQLMNRSLREYYRILKPGKWMTMEFSNTSASVWNSIQNALQGVGFVIAGVAALDKQLGSFKAVTTTTAVKQDLVITCYKPSEELSSQFELQMNRKDVVWDFIQEHMEHLAVHVEKGSKTTTVIERSPKILYDRLISYYVQHGLPVPMDAQEFQQGLRERFVERDGMFFTAVQAADYEEKRKHTDGFAPMGIIVSDEANGIEWLKNLLRESPKTYQQIQPEWMQAINGLRKGDILPELKTLLEENFIEEPDGRWRLPNIQDDVDKNLLRTKALLKEFNLYKEQALKPKAKLKEVRVEALRAGFKQCYIDKDFQTIVTVAEKIPQNLRDEDEVLLQFYDIAMNKL
mgnify:CR=1 FL=1